MISGKYERYPNMFYIIYRNLMNQLKEMFKKKKKKGKAQKKEVVKGKENDGCRRWIYQEEGSGGV